MNEMKVQQRFGLERLPVVTVAVFAVTAVMNGLQFAVHGLLEHLQRTPAGLEGDWWRSFTSLFVQDGGVFGTVSNLAFLLVIGALAEQVLRPGRWRRPVAVIAALVGAGLALAQDIHGAAMVAGIVIAALLTLVVRERTAIVQA